MQRLGSKLAHLKDGDDEEAMHLIDKELQLFCLKSMCCRNMKQTQPAVVYETATTATTTKLPDSSVASGKELASAKEE